MYGGCEYGFLTLRGVIVMSKWISKRSAWLILGAIVLAGLLQFESAVASGRAVDMNELSGIRGGLQYCVGSLIDPNGVNCQECQYNGNGNYVKCNNVNADMALAWAAGQSPAQMWDITQTPCGGKTRRYSDSGCSNRLFPSEGLCSRTYNATSFVGYATGVYCGYY